MENDILENLGIKVTKQRKIIIAILEEVSEPITAEALYGRIENQEQINFSTVYRTLGMLAEKGAVIKSGEAGGRMYYELKNAVHTHGHEIECTACHKQITIDTCPLDAFSRMLSKETGFVITEHQLQIKGLCPECVSHQECISHSE